MQSQQMFNDCIARTESLAGTDVCFDRLNRMRLLPRHLKTSNARPLRPHVSQLKKVVQHTSQQRTRRRKRSTSDCFFFWSSSTYFRAPIFAVDERRQELADCQEDDISSSGPFREEMRVYRPVSTSFPARVSRWWLAYGESDVEFLETKKGRLVEFCSGTVSPNANREH